MNGNAIIFAVDGASTRQCFTVPPALDWLQSAVGGFIEIVPGFTSIEVAGVPRHRVACVALCNEHGKLDPPLPFNLHASLLWEAAGAKLRDAHGDWVEWLAGPVLVLYGDDDFMAAL